MTAGTSASTQPESRSLVSGSAIYLASNALNALIPFLLMPVLTRKLGPAQYGEAAMFQTLLSALVALTGLSLQGAAGRKYYDFDTESSELGVYIGACFELLVASVAVVGVLTLVFRHVLATSLGIDERWLPWAVVAAGATVVVQMRMTQWQIRRRAVLYGILQVSQSFLNMTLSLLLVVTYHRGAAGRIDAMIWVPLGVAVVALVLLRRDHLVAFAPRWDFVKEAAEYGVPLLPHTIGLLLLGTFDRVIVSRQLGVAEAGIYMVAVQMAMGLALVFDAVNNSYVPWLFERLKRNVTEEKRQIVRWTYVYFAFALATAAGAFVLGPLAVTLVAGAAYRDAGTALGWLALGQALAGMYLVVTNYILYSKRTGLLSLATIVSGALMVALLTPLIRNYGLRGAAWAFAIGMFVRFLLTWWVANLRHPMPWLSGILPGQIQTVNAQR